MRYAQETLGAAAPIGHRRIVGIVLGLLLPVFLASLDGTIVATALPTIGRDLGGSTDLSWIVTVYLLTSTAAAPLIGKISDIRGRRATMLSSQVVFLVGSLGCALSPSIPLLILARAVQGAGSGGLITQSMTILGDVAAPKERARYYTYFSVIYTASGAIGPALGGFFAEHLHWSMIFWLNMPVGLTGLYLTNRSLRGLPRHERPHALDVPGAVLMVAASVALMAGLDAGGAMLRWTSPAMLSLLGVSVLLWAAFVIRLLRAPEPLIPLRVLRDPIVRAATACNACGWGAMIALNIYLPIYLQVIDGRSPVESGLSLMIVMFTMNLSALVGAQLAARVTRYKLYPLGGLMLAFAATVWLAYVAPTVGSFGFETLIALIGLGFGPTAPVTSVALQNAVRLEELGTSIASMTFARNLFTTMLLAAFGAIIFHQLPEERARAGVAGLSATARIAAGGAFQLVFLLAALSFLVSFVFMVLMEERPLAASNEGRP